MEVVQSFLNFCADTIGSVVQELPVLEDGTKTTILVRCAAGVAGIYILFRLFQSHKKSKLRKRWDSVGKDVVVLHQPGRGRFTPSISPYPIKLETYLRMAKIPYQNDFKEPMGPKGKLPWITLNGVDTGDSQLCIELLSNHFNKDLNSSLSEEQKATARALRIMAEDHLYWVVLLRRWVYAKGRGLDQFQADLPWSFFVFLPLISNKLKGSAVGHGMGRHTEAEVIEMGIKDLKALSAFLGSKQFFMGQKATEVDCTMFGFLALGLWCSTPNDIFLHLLNGELSNLKDFCIRMKEIYWPDWDRCLYNPQ